ncbi:MAG: hypothetical protein FWG03_03330 [Clostridiales bacterium]|nr:hypothetical protein [Clostridiales bacterium]
MIKPEDYFDLVMKGFGHVKPVEIEEMTVLTEDIFKLYWMARVRFYSFIAMADELDETMMRQYMMACVQFSKKNRSKLGEPIVCNGVVMSGDVKQSAVDYAQRRPALHTTMDEYPIIVDLKSGEVHYYTGPILYGIIYAKFGREYIDGHFALPARILAGKL